MSKSQQKRTLTQRVKHAVEDFKHNVIIEEGPVENVVLETKQHKPGCTYDKHPFVCNCG